MGEGRKLRCTMVSFLKLVLCIAATRFGATNAFVSSGASTAYRPPLTVASAADLMEGSGCYAWLLLSSLSPRTTALPMSTTATPTAPTITRPKIEKLSDVDVHNEYADDKDRGWLVRLYNDPMNKREFVARCLAEVCGIDDGASYMIMMKAHQTGIAVIGNYHRELAELYKSKLIGEGLLIDMVPADDE